jgi:hypothetical protein
VLIFCKNMSILITGNKCLSGQGDILKNSTNLCLDSRVHGAGSSALTRNDITVVNTQFCFYV